MKNIIKNITLCGLVAVGAGMGLSSCEDFLTITPTDRIVEEDFWKDKRDLNNAIMACYWRLSGSDILSKFVYWGEERSDNLILSSGVSKTSPMANIMNANLLPTYEQFNWTPLYNAINYCNKVIAHGEDVVKADESFSEGSWRPIRAEAITLRALCHFYLVRTFGEIPYVTVDFNNDSQDLRTAQSTQLTVLNNIIEDLESVKDEAMVNYGNNTDNRSRVTRKMVHALLADVYLWRASYKAGNNQPFAKVTLANNYAGEQTEDELKSRYEDYGTTAEEDYQKCIEYCDLVIERAKQEKIESNRNNVGFSATAVTLSDLLVGNETNGIITGTAYNQIFGIGNSEESILELQIDGESSKNTMITSLFWNINETKAGTFTSPSFMQNIPNDGPNNLTSTNLFTRTDYRYWGTFRKAAEQKTFDIIKYAATSISQQTSPYNELRDNRLDVLATNDIRQVLRSSSNVNAANWIVYRLSEIYLMKAEAMSQLCGDEDEANLREAFSYVREVFKRSNPYAYGNASQLLRKDSLVFTTFNTSENMEALVITERQREFIGEGKRWYDLVRYALRRGNTKDMLELLTRKYSDNREAIKAKLADMQTLYSPVYNNEIRNNNLLYQNGVWHVNETSSRTDDL
ncbi:MAG: RagB/SusD family nutrient uptake outer membrane protein [Prevotellaceae bacterium]|nr:RagB/SusD family nutrient uptake outer membrane protein [Prevotellaceae bacterium]